MKWPPKELPTWLCPGQPCGRGSSPAVLQRAGVGAVTVACDHVGALGRNSSGAWSPARLPGGLPDWQGFAFEVHGQAAHFLFKKGRNTQPTWGLRAGMHLGLLLPKPRPHLLVVQRQACVIFSASCSNPKLYYFLILSSTPKSQGGALTLAGAPKRCPASAKRLDEPSGPPRGCSLTHWSHSPLGRELTVCGAPSLVHSKGGANAGVMVHFTCH